MNVAGMMEKHEMGVAAKHYESVLSDLRSELARDPAALQQEVLQNKLNNVDEAVHALLVSQQVYYMAELSVC